MAVHIAFVSHVISTDVVVPDDVNRENEIRQNLRSASQSAFGYDLDAGSDLNFGKWFVEGGGRFAKSFNVPQQLGDGAVSIHPGYIQIYLGIGVNSLDRGAMSLREFHCSSSDSVGLRRTQRNRSRARRRRVGFEQHWICGEGISTFA